MEISADLIQRLFDSVPDVLFFIKDSEGRYTYANMTLIRRLGLKRRDEVIGKKVSDLYAKPFGADYAEQDRRVLAGDRLDNYLEVHLFPNRAPGWCLTCKEPIYVRNRICGLVGISRDLVLGQLEQSKRTYGRLSVAIKHLKQHFSEDIRVRDLAEIAGVSVAQFERHIYKIFHLTPRQLIARFRIEAAMRLLATEGSVASIGQSCGFTDQSAFARQFKSMVGMTPRNYRVLLSTTRADLGSKGDMLR